MKNNVINFNCVQRYANKESDDLIIIKYNKNER